MSLPRATEGEDITDPVERTVLWILWCAYGMLVIRGLDDHPAAARIARAIARELAARRSRVRG